MTATFDAVLQMDRDLAAAGHFPFTDWWRSQLERYYSSPARTFVGRVGRGGVKSHTSAKVALAETLFGNWKVPPGERHFWAFVSISKDEAAQRLTLLKSFLTALKIKFDASGDEIALRDLNRGFRVFSASIGAVSGFRCYGYSADELAKWTSSNEYANPASEICASLNAMTVTHPGARRLLISSSFGTEDYHAEAFDRGNTTDQIVSYAPSWIANPSLTEADTHAAEPDPKVWSREYLAEPSSTVSNAFDRDEVLACFGRVPSLDLGSGWVSIDASSLRGDAFAICSGQCSSDGEILVDCVDGFGDERLKNLSMATVVDRIAEHARRVGTNMVFGDQREEASLRVLLAEVGLELHSFAWSEGSKDAAVMAMRRWLRDAKLSVTAQGERTEILRKELTGMRARLLPSGRFSYPTNGLDYASALVTLAHAENEGEIGISGGNPLLAAIHHEAMKQQAKVLSGVSNETLALISRQFSPAECAELLATFDGGKHDGVLMSRVSRLFSAYGVPGAAITRFKALIGGKGQAHVEPLHTSAPHVI